MDRNCIPWTKTYFNDHIKGTTYEDDGYTIEITSIESITGDCDVTQRKGKVLCIYDLQLSLALTGKAIADEKTFTGSIKLGEFVHDQDEDEYEFEILVDDYTHQVKTLLIPVLKSKLMNFQSDLIKAHENEVQHATD